MYREKDRKENRRKEMDVIPPGIRLTEEKDMSFSGYSKRIDDPEYQSAYQGYNTADCSCNICSDVYFQVSAFLSGSSGTVSDPCKVQQQMDDHETQRDHTYRKMKIIQLGVGEDEPSARSGPLVRIEDPLKKSGYDYNSTEEPCANINDEIAFCSFHAEPRLITGYSLPRHQRKYLPPRRMMMQPSRKFGQSSVKS